MTAKVEYIKIHQTAGMSGVVFTAVTWPAGCLRIPHDGLPIAPRALPTEGQYT